MTSWPSRDPEKNAYGGAIHSGYFIFSFSGLPELGDEAVMFVTAMLVNGVGQRKYFEELAQESGSIEFL